MYTWLCLYCYIYMAMYIWLCIDGYVCMYVQVCLCAYVCMAVHVLLFLYGYVYMPMLIWLCMHGCLHTCMYVALSTNYFKKMHIWNYRPFSPICKTKILLYQWRIDILFESNFDKWQKNSFDFYRKSWNFLTDANTRPEIYSNDSARTIVQ